jgi:prevent-host-death family protein
MMYKTYMKRLAASEARGSFAEALNRVAYQGERVVMHRRGKPVAALVPLEDLAILEALENERDLAGARKALREKGSVPLEKLKAELGP